MDHFRMVLCNETGTVEISRGTKQELMESLKNRKDLALIFIRIATNTGHDAGLKKVGEKQITWNL
jgi:hypothetical protein